MISLLKDDSFNASLTRNWLIQIFWWIIFFPGFFSTDSFAAVEMARSGNLTNAFTASWAIYVRIFSFHGHFIGLLTLIDGLVLVYSVTRIAYSIFEKNNAAVSSFILTLTPLVWAMGITLWHDIPMTSGFLLIVTFFTNIRKLRKKPSRMQIIDLCLGSILISFRPNGLPTLLLFLFILSIFKKNKRNNRYVAASCLVAISFTIIPSLLFLNQTPINNYYAQEWMRNDISCYASTNNGNGFVEKYLPGIGSTEEWGSSAACKFLNTFSLSKENKEKSLDKVYEAWIRLAIEDPIFIIKTHSMRNAYLIPIPLKGLPTVPFLHSNIELKDENISWLMPKLAEYTRIFIRLWNALRNLLAWAGIWLIATIVISKLKRDFEIHLTTILNVCLLSILFVSSPIPDGRYALLTLITGQLIFIGFCTKIKIIRKAD